MRLRAALLVLAALLSCLAYALAAPRAAYAATETFALLADTHLGLPGQRSYEEVEDALVWASELEGCRAVAVAGDLTDRGDAASYSEWEYLCASYLDGIRPLVALGDHDTGKNGIYLGIDRSLTPARCYARFLDMTGGKATSMGTFSNANVITFGGASASGSKVVTDAGLAELDARLRATARAGKVAIVVCHYPYSSPSLGARAKLMGVLRSYPNVVYVSGHRHRYRGAARCQSVAPACVRTKYRRAGYDRARKYPFTSIGVNACSAYRSGDYSYADSLQVSGSGSMRLTRWNLTKGTFERVWTFRQPKSSVVLKLAPANGRGGKKARLTYKVTFSDGGTYGGVKSGGRITLSPGSVKRFSGIPAGVLVKAKLVRAGSGWSGFKAVSLEAGTSQKTLRLSPTYKKPGKKEKARSSQSANAKKLSAAR